MTQNGHLTTRDAVASSYRGVFWAADHYFSSNHLLCAGRSSHSPMCREGFLSTVEMRSQVDLS